ncbi:ABC transporter permease [Candidatus Poriferisodalis sp.]|uniref:ABC transporter permease n=1 Tax=Candidatus Poriferisodalis sp. TaxID=3101277 RepID=UPI003B5CAF14
MGVIEWPFAKLLATSSWTNGCCKLSWLTVCLAVFLLGWLVRNFQVGRHGVHRIAHLRAAGRAAYWRQTALTIGFISVAVLLCVIVGIPIGVLCGRVDSAWKVVRPVLDAMQVVHSFVYMLPFIFFFGIGFVSATMVTMTFALPPLIRLTNLGIRQVPEDVVEASRAYGAPEWRVLTDVQLPLARPAIMTGLNQTLLLAISMLGIAAIMGAGGLGRLLFTAISNLDIALAGSAGLAFFLVAVVLDRLSQPESSDSGNLLSRITQAWANRRTPEKLLVQAGRGRKQRRSQKAGGTTRSTRGIVRARRSPRACRCSRDGCRLARDAGRTGVAVEHRCRTRLGLCPQHRRGPPDRAVLGRLDRRAVTQPVGRGRQQSRV